MGIYLNPGAEMLRQGRRSQVYVDKSGMLGYLDSVLGTERKFVCVSRPRRFGKTMAANMVCAYYDRTVDGAAEFSGLEAATAPGFDANRNRYDVLSVNVSQIYYGASRDLGKAIANFTRGFVWDLGREYPGLKLSGTSSLRGCMEEVFAQTGVPFVFVIDSWDCPIRLMASEEEQSRYLGFLKDLLSDAPWLSLVYMTGILPIKKYGTHLALNMFSEFSMLAADELAPYVGFTGAEVRALCDKWDCDFDECRAWYDGYLVSGVHGSRVEAYSPCSVVCSVETGNFRSYWNETETFEALRRYIDMDMDGLRSRVVELMGGGRVAIETRSYVNDMSTFASADDVLTLLVHLGYLTYDDATREVFVPNREVMGEFANSVEAGREGWGEVARSIRESEALLGALVAGDADAVAAGVERAHEDAASVIAYNGEASLAATLRLAFFSAVRRWRLVREAPAGKGYADLTLIPLASAPAGTPGVVVELKFGATAEEALAQIRERGYDRALDGLVASGDVVLCGIVYDPATKRHSCVIERV